MEPFLGAWRLRADASRYEFGAPPREAVYRIERDGEWLLFAARWTGADGRRLEMSFAGIPDGEPHDYEDPAVADTITTRLVDARTLETVAAKDGRDVAVGRRVLSDDGAEMTVTQSGTTPDGKPFANVSVYDRVRP
ncbi:MAG TPA: hypothetical protein VHG91_13000 [Longimicrobium sp.]|nr:hypothetical protein [Longimicrobium sp.]